MKKILLYMLILLCFSCTKEEKYVVATVMTTVTNVTSNSAVIGVDVNIEQGKDASDINIAETGCYYETKGNVDFEFRPNQSYADYTGLAPLTTYQVQAYATIGDHEVRGNIVTFTTEAEAPTTALVRFRKTAVSFWTIMTVDMADGGDELARYEFGTGTGTSSYYEIPAGNHKIWFYDDNNNGWIGSSELETFQAGHKYTITIDENSYNDLTYSFNDDGTFSSSDLRSSTPTPTPTPTPITVPKESLKVAKGMAQAITDKKLFP